MALGRFGTSPNGFGHRHTLSLHKMVLLSTNNYVHMMIQCPIVAPHQCNTQEYDDAKKML